MRSDWSAASPTLAERESDRGSRCALGGTWIKEDATKVGYEVSFTRHFYKPQPLRTLEQISADILAIEKEAEGLLDGLLKVGAKS